MKGAYDPRNRRNNDILARVDDSDGIQVLADALRMAPDDSPSELMMPGGPTFVFLQQRDVVVESVFVDGLLRCAQWEGDRPLAKPERATSWLDQHVPNWRLA